MGRPRRTRIDFAKTISWYDFFYNQLVYFGRYKNDYDMEKFFYGYPEEHDVKSLFKKYKFGLSTPQKYWISIVESKCIGSSDIINHPLWKILKYQRFDEDLILLELTALPQHIVKIISSNGRIKDFDKSDLEHIANFGSLDSFCALYLLHHWGVIINSTALANDCCSFLINSLGLLLEKNPHLHRSHILLFDELCNQIVLTELKGYSRPLKIKLNWREYRRKHWPSAIKEISTKAEADFRFHPKLQDFIPGTDPNLAALFQTLFG
ncbi:hypothetical protein ABFP25_15105 [Acinetobacter indicus]|jgi:hypothetical protein|uniref:hypothetical protein n=1 Tax=Acinetobacter indicus TaxID=756892 RepID=UPI003215D096